MQSFSLYAIRLSPCLEIWGSEDISLEERYNIPFNTDEQHLQDLVSLEDAEHKYRCLDIYLGIGDIIYDNEAWCERWPTSLSLIPNFSMSGLEILMTDVVLSAEIWCTSILTIRIMEEYGSML